MSRFNDRVERDLRHIADEATPSSTAWEAIQTRIAEQANQPELEITMLKPNPTPHRRARTWILGAAAALLLIVGGLYVALSRDDDSSLDVVDDPEISVPTTPPTTTSTTVPTAAPPAEVSSAALATIEAFLGSTDLATLQAVVTESALVASSDNALSVDADGWLVSRQVLGLEVELLSCLEAGAPTSIRCQVSLRSNMSEARGQEPRLRGVTFDFTDGLISSWPIAVAASDFDETRELAIAAGFQEEVDAACQGATLECAEFVMANLDAWVAAEAALGE